MTIIIYKSTDGSEQSVEASPGDTLMTAAVNAGIAGIDGDCGGNCACATCHLYVDSEITGTRNEEEQDMLAIADDVKEISRLGCQIEITAEMDGLVVQIPAGQH